MSERSYPASEVRRGGQRTYPASEVRAATRGVTCVRGQGWWPGGDTPLPKPEAKGGGQKELPHAPTPKAHIQEALAAQVQEGLEELSHIEGQEGQR